MPILVLSVLNILPCYIVSSIIFILLYLINLTLEKKKIVSIHLFCYVA